MVESEKQRIRREFERKEAQIESRKRIEHSTKVNQARLRVLRAREECIRAAIGAAHATLATITADQAKYSQLLVSLTAQAMAKVAEPAMQVRCRRADLALVEAAAPKAAAQYARAAGCAPPSVVVNTEAFLPAAAAPGFEGESCAGGVVVASMDGKIVCANTLDERLAVAHDTNLPVIRKRLFGE